MLGHRKHHLSLLSLSLRLPHLLKELMVLTPALAELLALALQLGNQLLSRKLRVPPDQCPNGLCYVHRYALIVFKAEMSNALICSKNCFEEFPGGGRQLVLVQHQFAKDGVG